MGAENLKPVQSKDEARERGRKGGLKSGEVRRQKRTLKEQMETLLSLPVKDDNTRNFIESLGIDPETIDNATAITLSIYQEALKGNTKAYELIRDTLGEKPTDKLQVEEAPVIVLKRPQCHKGHRRLQCQSLNS